MPTGEPGRVTIFDGERERRATRADSARFMAEVDTSRQLSIHDEDSAFAYHAGIDIRTTGEDRRATVASLIDLTTPRDE